MKRLLMTILLAIGLLTAGTGTDQPAYAQEAFQLKYNQLIHNFYRDPKPEMVPPILKELLESDVVRYGQVFLDNSHHLYAYTFGRLAMEEESLVPLYREIFKTSSLYARRLMTEVFQICGDSDTRAFLIEAAQDPENAAVKEDIALALSGGIPLKYSPLNYPIFTQQDLDLHWVEFFVSGSTAALARILDVLDRPDVLRERATAFFAGDASEEDKLLAVQLFDEILGIKVDETTYDIADKQDLGGVIATRAQTSPVTPEKVQQMQDLLGLTDIDLLSISAKGAAIWSVQSNARLHRNVFEFCEQQIGNHGEQAQLVLREIAARAYFQLEEFDKAKDQLMELIAMNPDRYEMNSFLAEVNLAQGDIDEAKRQLDYIARRDEDLADVLRRRIQREEAASLSKDSTASAGAVEDVATYVSSLRQRAKNVSSYRSYAAIVTDSINVMEWDYDYVAPDRFSVEQLVMSRGQRVLNKWMSIEDELYVYMGVWIRDKEKVSQYDRTINTLRLSKWLDSLPAAGKIKASRRTKADKQYVLLEFEPTDLNNFFARRLPEETDPAQAQLWVDYDTGFVHKGSVAVKTIAESGNKVEFTYEQEFFGINEGGSIEIPERVVDVAETQQSADGSAEGQENTPNAGAGT